MRRRVRRYKIGNASSKYDLPGASIDEDTRLKSAVIEGVCNGIRSEIEQRLHRHSC